MPGHLVKGNKTPPHFKYFIIFCRVSAFSVPTCSALSQTYCVLIGPELHVAASSSCRARLGLVQLFSGTGLWSVWGDDVCYLWNRDMMVMIHLLVSPPSFHLPSSLSKTSFLSGGSCWSFQRIKVSCWKNSQTYLLFFFMLVFLFSFS